MPLSLNTVQTDTNAPINANAATTAKAHLANWLCQTDVLASMDTSVLVVEVELSAGSGVMQRILMRPTHPTVQVAFA
jgi:hypothetical protein